MKRAILAGAAAFGLALATAPAVMAQEDAAPEYGVTTTTISQTECGTATITWTNPTRWAFTADYRVEGDTGTADQYSNQRISEGPLAGQKFAKQFHPIALPAGGSSDSVTVTLEPGTETVNVKAWVKRGPEQRSFSSASAEVKPCAPEATPPADEGKQDDGKTDTPPADEQAPADDQPAGNGTDSGAQQDGQDTQQGTDDASADGTAPTPEPQPAHIAVTG